MASIVAIRAGLAANINTIPGLNVTAHVADRISPPAVVIGEVSIEFDKTMGRGLDEISLTARVYVGRADDRSSQDKLDGYLAGSGALSIKAAIESDLTLGGAAETLRCATATGYGVYEVAGMQYVGAEFPVTVYARGN